MDIAIFFDLVYEHELGIGHDLVLYLLSVFWRG